MKGDRCAFAHVDDQGKNWHAPVENRPAQTAAQEIPKRSAESVEESAASGSSAKASAKRSKPSPSEEQRGDDKQVVRADACSASQGSNASHDSSEAALFTWSTKNSGDIHKWLHEGRAAGRREVVTESDVLLERLEGLFGPLGVKMNGAEARRKRGLERQLFGAWCDWLCRPSRSAKEEGRKREQFRYW